MSLFAKNISPSNQIWVSKATGISCYITRKGKMLFFLLSNSQHFPAVVALICLFLVPQIEITVYKKQQLLEECTACHEQQRLDSHLKTPRFVWFVIVRLVNEFEYLLCSLFFFFLFVPFPQSFCHSLPASWMMRTTLKTQNKEWNAAVSESHNTKTNLVIIHYS